MFWLELGEDDAGDDDDDAEDFEPAEGLLADEDGGDEREDGYGVVEDAGFGSSQDADTEVVEGVGEGGAADAKDEKHGEHVRRVAEQRQVLSVEQEYQWQEIYQSYEVLPCGYGEGAVALDNLDEQQGVDDGYDDGTGEEEQPFGVAAQ